MSPGIAEAGSADAVPAMPDRRERLHRTIAALVRQRQDVIVGYCRLAGVTGFLPQRVDSAHIEPDKLRAFCQLMIDYVALGHFELYQRIIEGRERREAVRDVAEQVYPAIARTTDFLVDFNDRYEDFDGSEEQMGRLSADLSALGEMLTERGEKEDLLLDALGR